MVARRSHTRFFYSDQGRHRPSSGPGTESSQHRGAHLRCCDTWHSRRSRASLDARQPGSRHTRRYSISQHPPSRTATQPHHDSSSRLRPTESLARRSSFTGPTRSGAPASCPSIPPTPMSVEAQYSADLSLLDVHTGAVDDDRSGIPASRLLGLARRPVLSRFTSSAGMSGGSPGGQGRPSIWRSLHTSEGHGRALTCFSRRPSVSQLGLSVAWSPNGRYLAYAVLDSTSRGALLYRSAHEIGNRESLPCPDSVHSSSGPSFLRAGPSMGS